MPEEATVTVLLRKSAGGEWHEPAVTAYANEAHLQRILLCAPQLLPTVPTPAVAVAEVETVEGCLADILCISHDGSITVCECKLRRNHEIKRWVVGQLFAYAAGLWRLTYDDLDRRLTRSGGASLEMRMSQQLELSEVGNWDGIAFRERVTANLTEGRFRLIFAVDEITEELRRTVQFLNLRTAPGLSILALEMGYVQDDDVEILVPNLYGAEIANQKDHVERGAWDRESFLAALQAQGGDRCLNVVQSIMEWARQRGAEDRFGVGTKSGSWFPIWSSGPRRFSAWTDGTLSIDIWQLRKGDNFDEPAFLKQVRDRLGAVGLVLTTAKDSPALQMSAITDPAAQRAILDTLEWIVAETG